MQGPTSSTHGDEWTVAAWALLPEETPGEVVDGLLIDEEMPDFVHETVVKLLLVILHSWIHPRGGVVFGSEAKYQVRATRGRKADLSVFMPGRPMPPRRGASRVPPDIVIEVISPTPRDARRDRVEKPDDYAEFGVRFYWIVDPEERTLEVFELSSDARYVRAFAAGEGQLTGIPGCEGLTLDLDALWAETERLAPEDTNGETAADD